MKVRIRSFSERGVGFGTSGVRATVEALTDEVCFAYAAAEGHPERSLRLAGAAAALRQSVGAPPNSAERERLEKCLIAARVAVSTTAGSAAWMEGFAMPPEKAIAHALSPE
mgnify:CR=1 FL=1